MRNFVTAYITGKVPAIAAPVLNPILAAYIELATEYLDKITAVTGTTTFVVSHHLLTPPSPSPTSSCSASGTAIPSGTYAGPINGHAHDTVAPELARSVDTQSRRWHRGVYGRRQGRL